MLNRFIDEVERIRREPEPFTALQSLAELSVNIVVRVWVNALDYWSIYFPMNEKVYLDFEKEGLAIPFPKLDVNLHKSE